MPKRTIFTNITPLPPKVSREVAVAMLHNHDEMIELNPLVIEHHPIKTPRDAPVDEFLDCVWQELTDRIHFMPGGLVKGKVSYKACFHDMPNGLQTHIYAPMGLDIREKWSIGGSLPGEPPEARELGLKIPSTGLYIREDCDMSCNVMLSSFVRKNLDNAHKVLVERILRKSELIEEHLTRTNATRRILTSPRVSSFQRGSHMAQSQILSAHVAQSQLLSSPRFGSSTSTSPLPTPTRSQFPDLSIHPAFRNDPLLDDYQQDGLLMPPSYQTLHGPQYGYPQDVKQNPYLQLQTLPSPPHTVQVFPRQERQASSSPPRHEMLAELPNTPEHVTMTIVESYIHRNSISELATEGSLLPSAARQKGKAGDTDGASVASEVSSIPNQRYRYSSLPGSRRPSDLRSEQSLEIPTAPPSVMTFI